MYFPLASLFKCLSLIKKSYLSIDYVNDSFYFYIYIYCIITVKMTITQNKQARVEFAI